MTGKDTLGTVYVDSASPVPGEDGGAWIDCCGRVRVGIPPDATRTCDRERADAGAIVVIGKTGTAPEHADHGQCNCAERADILRKALDFETLPPDLPFAQTPPPNPRFARDVAKMLASKKDNSNDWH